MILDFNVPYTTDNFHQLPKNVQSLCQPVEDTSDVGILTHAELAASDAPY